MNLPSIFGEDMNEETIPPHVASAMRYLGFARGIEAGREMMDGVKAEGRALTKMEKGVYDSALVLLSDYFQQDFSNQKAEPAAPEPPPGPPPPAIPVPAPTGG